MAYMMNDPRKCVDRKQKGNKTCMECYVSQVTNGHFTGDMKCFNSGCIHETCQPKRFPNKCILLKNGYLINESEKTCKM